eukprot:TRINITY_DN9587_c0_g1_i1.p1 TRINITY_DN9587_c0_g1~~TRINITY_DN9587_c0_g1_i1.p1  ORF type:complete len:341 (-),score=34.93 TRINITY_DN9587_c0_g1_i1:40-1062(-)
MINWIILIFLCYQTISYAQDVDVDFGLWNTILNENVYFSNSSELGQKSAIQLTLFNYLGIRNSTSFQLFLDQLKNAKLEALTTNSSWYAFWINTYNALAINLVLSNPCKKDLFGYCGPISSICQVDTPQPAPLGWIISVWNKTAGTVGGKNVSLTEITEMLRYPGNNTIQNTTFTKNPLFFACTSCMSVSCPDLRNESFNASKLDQQMNDQMRTFLSNKNKGLNLQRQSISLTVSNFFDLFSSDFNSENYSVLPFFLEFLDVDDREFVVKNFKKLNDSLDFFEFDWALNGNAQKLCSKRSRTCYPWWTFVGVGLFGLVIISIIFCIIRKITSDRKEYEHH